MAEIVIICGLCEAKLGTAKTRGMRRVRIQSVCAKCSRELSNELAPNGIGFKLRGEPMPWSVPIRYVKLIGFVRHERREKKIAC